MSLILTTLLLTGITAVAAYLAVLAVCLVAHAIADRHAGCDQ